VVAVVAILWYGNWWLGLIIALAMVINLGFAALAGVALPIVFRKLGIDPALAGGVALTTVTDVVGFLAFLGLAAIFLV
jgi:magnesium transporter